MALIAGTRLGPYEITSLIGEGGMGEVYRARDTKLHRDVAIKVLPDNVAEDPERLARFEREARTLATLNHPHIAQIHGLEDRALVMEFVDGEDLAARIARGPLPLDEALAVAKQIAMALDAAHSAGIVHRDLKPANIKLRPDGTVKVLDFGLAKAIEGAGGAGGAGQNLLNSPTITSPLVTNSGVILGTAAYMSPEQARGRPVDKRTDIWAFGCVFYEMLTAHAPFEGETVTDVLGSIVKSEPDWTKLPADAPPAATRLIKRCLEKDASKRLRDIGDAISELETGFNESAAALVVPMSPSPRSRALLGAAWIGTLIAVGAGTALYVASSRSVAPDRLQKFHIAVQGTAGNLREPVIAPDGRRITFVKNSRLWVQELDQWEARELPGTDGASRPFWSPNSDWIGYARAEQLLKVPAAGGPVVPIGKLPAVQAPLGGGSGAWGRDGVITFSLAAASFSDLLRIPSGGGPVQQLTYTRAESVTDLHDIEHLPDGSIICAIHRTSGVDALGLLKDGKLTLIRELTAPVRHPSYSPTGHLVFEQGLVIWAMPFSLDTLTATGDPFVIGDGREPSVARDGTLSFVDRTSDQARHLAWFTMDGKVGSPLTAPTQWTEGVALARDGRRLLAATSDGIWSYDVATGGRSRLTTDSSDMTPRWIDDSRFVFVRHVNNTPALFVKTLGASGEERALARIGRFPQVTGDGRRVVFNYLKDGTTWVVAWLDLAQPGDPQLLQGIHTGARFPTISPDGSLVAYVSGEIGHDEIFLTTLPQGEGKFQLSTNGGGWALFGREGDAVYYRSPGGDFMKVAISRSGDELKIGTAQKLFDWNGGWAPFYDIVDSQRGITAVVSTTVTEVASISIVQNWFAEFAGKQP